MQTKSKTREEGIVWFIATEDASIVSIIGLSVMSVVLKEMKLSALEYGSTQAYFAADTGIECAMYWDIRHPGYSHSIFATSTVVGDPVAQGFPDLSAMADPITCATTRIATTPSGYWDYNNPSANPVSNSIAATTTFIVYYDDNDITQPCANVIVAKTQAATGILTRIYSRGLNTCDTSQRYITERGLYAEYLVSP